jgi:ABC-type nitrate/sulfonate/bicarbonate transport system ATPase subunit
VTAAEPLLELDGVEAHGGGRRLLRVDALAVGRGEVLAVLGPNGAGKSTLLRVAGALRPFTGTVRLAGRTAGPRELRAATAAVLQRPLLLRGSVRDNAATGLRFRGASRREARRSAEPWLRRLGLAELADRPAAVLSAGEAQRVSLARAMAVRPLLLLLDEPFSALDAPTRGELVADLGDVLRESGTAAMLVTHDRHEAAAVADRGLILHAGAVRQAGPLPAVLDAPADADVARTLGFENLLGPDAPMTPPVAPGRLAAFRADDLRPVPPGGRTPAGAALIEATLRRVVPAGPRARVDAQAGGTRIWATCEADAPSWLAASPAGTPIVLAALREPALLPTREPAPATARCP